MVAYVRRARKNSGHVPQWMGGKMPLSSELASVVLRKLAEARDGVYSGVEMRAVRPVLETQKSWSDLPGPGQLLVEVVQMGQATQQFLFPFAGRLVHEGLSALVAHRISMLRKGSFSVTVNDYGFGLLCPGPVNMTPQDWRSVLSPANLVDDLLSCLNSAELAKRQFREIARVAGLVFQGFPGRAKSVRQLQASSGLFFEVFSRYDPDNLLLTQARREVLERQLEVGRMRSALEAVSCMELNIRTPPRLTPLSFPLWASFVQATLSSEHWLEKIQRMAQELEAAAKAESTV
jgi:ATP-dependent Lhr-like helicase